MKNITKTALFSTIFFSICTLFAIEIRETPIEFSSKRVELTKAYIKSHYNLTVKDIKITPKIIVVHHTAIDDFGDSLACLVDEELQSKRVDIKSGGTLNVSAHFMIERDGTIHQLMPLDFMARHVIGLNYNSIGIENVGGQNSKDNLTKEQLNANIALIKELKKRFLTIKHVIGHSEYRCFEDSELWLEIDKNYKTHKDDPSKRFMSELRVALGDKKGSPCD